jgi:hypothetical protein
MTGVPLGFCTATASASGRILKRIEAEDPATRATEYTLHGLRKNAGNFIAEATGNVLVVAAALGHRNTATAEHYIKEANRKKWGDQVAAIMDARIEADRAELETLQRSRLTVVK